MRLSRPTARLRLGGRRREERQMRNSDEYAGVNTNNEFSACENGGVVESHVDRFDSDHLRDSSDNDSDDSDSDGDGDDLDLPSGYLAFLSNIENDIDNQLSAVADHLCGNDSTSPLFQINFVREFIYDRGAILIAGAMEEGSPNHGSDGLNSQNSIVLRNSVNGTGTQTTSVPASPPCRCPSRLLREIVLSRCHIGDKGVCAVAHAISNSCTSSLRTLDLSSNNITGIGVTCLANCTLDCALETLVLSSNTILTVGAFALANALGGKRLECPLHHDHESISDSASSGSIPTNDTPGFCSLKHLHVSGCQLNDDDAILLGNALVSQCSNSKQRVFKERGTDPQRMRTDDGISIKLPSLPSTNKLMFLNLHRNHITLRGMEFLHSVIHNSSPGTTKNKTGDDSDLNCLQFLYCESNHAVELGVIVDYGTRDYNYGNFFDQEEDEQLLMGIRNYETGGVEPNVDIEQMRKLLTRKWVLKEKMMLDLHINRQCALALENASVSVVPSGQLSPTEKRQQILSAAASKKIAKVFEELLCPRSITLPRRQDEYGRYIDEYEIVGRVNFLRSGGPEPPKVGKHTTGLDLNIFPLLFSWLNHNVQHLTALAILFDIICANPDVCGFHSAYVSKAPADGSKRFLLGEVI